MRKEEMRRPMTQAARQPARRDRTLPRFVLRLYIRGFGPKMILAQENLRAFCDRYLAERHEIEIVDIDFEPGRAGADDIIAVPTLVRVAPGPVRRLVGDFSNLARLSQALDLPLP